MKVLITRPRAQAADFGNALQAAGFEPIYFPVIEIRPIENNRELDKAIKNIEKYDWVVFTSVNAVDIFFQFLVGAARWRPHPHAGGLGPSLPCVAAIGPKTADALRKHNIEPDFIPDEFVGEAIFSGLGDLQNKWVLLPRAEIARQELPEAVVKAGGIAHEIVVYQTLPAEINNEGLSALKSGMDVVTFTSASTVENFIEIARKNDLDPFNLPNHPTFACIGPITEQAAREAGFKNLVVAKEYTTEGMIQIISNLEAL